MTPKASMMLPLASTPNPSLLIIECGLTGIAAASAFAWPRLGAARLRAH